MTGSITRSAAVVSLLVPALLTGCGSAEETSSAVATETVTATVTGTPDSSSGAPSSAPSSAPTGTSSAPGQLPVALRMTGRGVGYFATPSGNISCFLVSYGTRSVECTATTRDYPDPPRPADCQGDWVPQFTLQERATFGTCRGDVTGSPDGTVLEYGTAAVNGPITCSSDPAGLTCRNGGTSHGFTVARAAYRIF